MMWLKWFPWRFLVKWLSRKHGFLDPVDLLIRLRGFSQPSEVAEPIELLRAGALFHARGLINSRVIQHNLDWIWPCWIERQFDPKDSAFIPRAFSLTHINLTHRNWTAVGIPDVDATPIVDPCGLITPFFDKWSIDFWLLSEDGALYPSKLRNIEQKLEMDDGLAVATRAQNESGTLTWRVRVKRNGDAVVCVADIEAEASFAPAWLVVAIRPFNPEGVSFIKSVTYDRERFKWKVDHDDVILNEPFDVHYASNYRLGDIPAVWRREAPVDHVSCDVGMATAAGFYKIGENGKRRVSVEIPLKVDASSAIDWSEALAEVTRLKIPDEHWQFLYDAAVRSITLHSPGEIYPGPFTYRRFWYRDASFIIQALLCCGLFRQAERAILKFPENQTMRGYFRSQNGEWDSNGEVLWIAERYCRFTGKKLSEELLDSMASGAEWIIAKRLSDDDSPHSGLLPAGFSAEHFGPNDYYYWDDFWSVAGLRAAAGLCEATKPEKALRFIKTADDLERSIQKSLDGCRRKLGVEAIPASPYRRLDGGMVGCVAASYPLALRESDDEAIRQTVEFLLENCLCDGAFFHDMTHSGINAYLTLHIAQTLLRAGDDRCYRLIRSVAKMASPTGQWPEAINPRTGGGCMGDGQHVWAAAEWIMMMRNCLLREEGERLIIGSGIPGIWLKGRSLIEANSAPTAFGMMDLKVRPQEKEIVVEWKAEWISPPKSIEVILGAYRRTSVPDEAGVMTISKSECFK